MIDRISCRAYAKINIGLDVTGRRADGYHLLDTIMQTVGIYDTLTIALRNDERICIRTNDPMVPSDESNLVYKASRLIQSKISGGNITSGRAIPLRKMGLDIEILKCIPVQSGMGGGSADAAAALRALEKLYDLDIEENELLRLGAKLGADVPFCMTGGTMRCTGIGEVLKPLPPLMKCQVIIVKPPEGISTPYVYKRLDEISYDHPDMDTAEDAVREGDLEKLCGCMDNVLEYVTAEEVKSIQKIKKLMYEYGAAGVSMSGSGTSVFGLYKDRAAADEAFGKLRKHFRDDYLILKTEIGGTETNVECI